MSMAFLIPLVPIAACILGLFIANAVARRRMRKRRDLVDQIRRTAPRHVVDGKIAFELTDEEVRGLGLRVPPKK